jgi:hypothetical protein
MHICIYPIKYIAPRMIISLRYLINNNNNIRYLTTKCINYNLYTYVLHVLSFLRELCSSIGRYCIHFKYNFN